jgi:hypothetical protein
VNVEKFNSAIDSMITGLTTLKEAISSTSIPDNRSCFDKVNIELLARQMAYSYSTLHPEYKVESQFRNLVDMVNNPSKITYVINWVRKKGTEGLEEFFQENNGNKQLLMKEALEKYENEIKEVFTKRFSK